MSVYSARPQGVPQVCTEGGQWAEGEGCNLQGHEEGCEQSLKRFNQGLPRTVGWPDREGWWNLQDAPNLQAPKRS